MSWDTPVSWVTVTLADVCFRIVDGSHNPPRGQIAGKPMLSAKNILYGKIFFDELRLLSDEDFEIENNRTNISAGDVLLTIVGALGRTAVVPEVFYEFTLQRSVAVLKPVIIDSNYLRYLLDSAIAQNFFLDNAKGTAQKGIYLKALGSMQIPIAPLAEQACIAQKLNELLSQVDTLKARIDAIPVLLKRFRQSVLAAAVSGRLIKQQQCLEQNNAHEHWVKGSLGDFAKIDIGHAFKSSEFSPHGVRLLRGQNIEPGSLRWTETKFYPKEKVVGMEHLYITEGDIILAMDRPIVSAGLKLARAKKVDTPCILVQRVSRFKNFKKLLPDYLMLILSDLSFSNYLIPNQTGSDIPHISGKQILNYSVALPTVIEQTEIVRRVEQLFAFADQLEAKVASAKKRIDHLTQSILAKAFRGELVPQDPNDEPASVLLERIKAQRAAVPKAKRGRKVSG